MKQARAFVLAPIAALALAGCGGGAMVSSAIDTINPMNWFGSSTPAPQMAQLPELTNPIAVKTSVLVIRSRRFSARQ